MIPLTFDDTAQHIHSLITSLDFYNKFPYNISNNKIERL